MAIHLFVTGGTIDGFDSSDTCRPSKYSRSRIPELLERARLSEPVAAETIVFKDGAASPAPTARTPSSLPERQGNKNTRHPWHFHIG